VLRLGFLALCHGRQVALAHKRSSVKWRYEAKAACTNTSAALANIKMISPPHVSGEWCMHVRPEDFEEQRGRGTATRKATMTAKTTKPRIGNKYKDKNNRTSRMTTISKVTRAMRTLDAGGVPTRSLLVHLLVWVDVCKAILLRTDHRLAH
jgi:hypothetical protein